MNQNTQNTDNFEKEPTASDSQIKGSPGGTEPPIALGPDGKPCRACTDFKSWTKQMTGGVVGKTAPAMASSVSSIGSFSTFPITTPKSMSFLMANLKAAYMC